MRGNDGLVQASSGRGVRLGCHFRSTSHQDLFPRRSTSRRHRLSALSTSLPLLSTPGHLLAPNSYQPSPPPRPCRPSPRPRLHPIRRPLLSRRVPSFIILPLLPHPLRPCLDLHRPTFSLILPTEGASTLPPSRTTRSPLPRSRASTRRTTVMRHLNASTRCRSRKSSLVRSER